MSGDDIVEQFRQLFRGREDAYGTDSGGCVRMNVDHPTRCVPFRQHLEGTEPIGVYPAAPYPTRDDALHCCWGAVDLDIRTPNKPAGTYRDEDECHIAAVNLQKTLKHFNATSWIERTRSNARHLWVFASTWVPASVMRRALLVATSVAGVSSREVNPKQTQLPKGSVGNYVRLPYPGVLGGRDEFHMPGQYMLSPHGSTLGFDHFVEQALATRTPIATLEHIASLYKEPERTVTWADAEVLHDYGMFAQRLNALARHLWLKPVDQIADRSMHIEAFVRAAKDSYLTASETLTLADDLAARCGKFDGRADRERQLRIIVERAWT